MADDDLPDGPPSGHSRQHKTSDSRSKSRRPRRRGDGSGGAGVREPRRPLPGGGADAVEARPEEPDGSLGEDGVTDALPD